MQLNQLLQGKTFQTTKKKIDFSFQALGLEIADHFKIKTKQVFWIFYKYPEQLIYEAFQEAKKRGKQFNYLLGILKNK